MTPRLYISEIDATATADEAIFSRYRLDKLRAAKSAARRAEGICAERLLIYALRDTMPEIEFPAEIVTDKSGKPELADVPLRFSLSHSGDRCACAVYDRAIFAVAALGIGLFVRAGVCAELCGQGSGIYARLDYEGELCESPRHGDTAQFILHDRRLGRNHAHSGAWRIFLLGVYTG